MSYGGICEAKLLICINITSGELSWIQGAETK